MLKSLAREAHVCVVLQVAFSAFTDFGAIMALAIAVHNIPEVGSHGFCTSFCVCFWMLHCLLGLPAAGSYRGSTSVCRNWQQMESHGHCCGFSALHAHFSLVLFLLRLLCCWITHTP